MHEGPVKMWLLREDVQIRLAGGSRTAPFRMRFSLSAWRAELAPIPAVYGRILSHMMKIDLGIRYYCRFHRKWAFDGILEG